MNKSFNTFWKTRSVAAFALILLFLTLGSCPVKKVFQFSFFSDAPKEQKAGPASGRIDVSCSYSEKSSVKASVNPDRATNPVPSAAHLLILSALLPGLLAAVQIPSYPVISPDNLQPVPVYLRNRTLLI